MKLSERHAVQQEISLQIPLSRIINWKALRQCISANDGVPSSHGRYAVIGCKLKQNANEGCNSCATVVQVLQDLFYVLLHDYFTCDRSFTWAGCQYCGSKHWEELIHFWSPDSQKLEGAVRR